MDEADDNVVGGSLGPLTDVKQGSSPVPVLEPQTGSSGERTGASAAHLVSLSGSEEEGGDEEVMSAPPVLPEVASRLAEMVPSYSSSAGAFEIGSESIYIHGVTPTRETDLSEFTVFHGLADCMRPLPIIPANLCPERSGQEIVTTRVHSGGGGWLPQCGSN